MSLTDGPKDNEPVTEEEWLECLELPEYLQRIPAGRIDLVSGEIIFIDGNGQQFSKEQYQAKWNCDPEVVWAAVKARRAQAGKNDKIREI